MITAGGSPPGTYSRENIKDYTLVDETITVDGVTYDAEKIRGLVREKYQMASEIIELRDKVRRADRHLRLRTAALVRVIARQ